MPGFGVLKIVCAFVPAVILLTVSFFVLVAARKVEGEVLKGFGYVIAVFLWISAALTAFAGIYGGGYGLKCFPSESHHMRDFSGMKDMMGGQPDCSMMEKMHGGQSGKQGMEHMMSK
jgi:hypothetical protein